MTKRFLPTSRVLLCSPIAILQFWCAIGLAKADAPTAAAIAAHWQASARQPFSVKWKQTGYVGRARQEETLECRLWSDGSRIGYAYEGNRVIESLDGPATFAYNNHKSTYDGTMKKSLFLNPGSSPPSGFIRADGYKEFSTNLDLKPVIWTHLPLISELSLIDLQRLTISGLERVEQDDCCILVSPWNQGTIKMWIGKSSLLTRKVRMESSLGLTLMEVELRYRSVMDSSSSTRLESWMVYEGSDENRRAIRRVQEVEYLSVNGFGAEDFDITFPVGSIVTDMRPSDKVDPDLGLVYIVRPDGERRIVTKEEVFSGAKYEDLVSTQTGEIFKKDSTWMTYLAGIAVLAFFLVLVYARVRPRTG